MIEQHLGRRSVSDFQRGVLALRKREIMAARRVRTQVPESLNPGGVDASVAVDVPPWEDSAPASAMDSVPLLTREDIAKAARLSSNQMVMIEKIQKQAAPEVVAALKSGDISLNAAAAVASLPAEEQVAAAVAGKDELKQAAKRVREAKRKPHVMPEEGADQEGLGVSECSPPADEVKALKQRIAQLEKENDALRKQVLNLLEKSQRMA
jgi:hypothetical protein